MPNYCRYAMKIKGNKENVDKLVSYLKYEGDKHFFRVFDFDIVKIDDQDNDTAYILSGSCAWSIYSCMFDGEHTYYNSSKYSEGFKGTTMVNESKELELDIEIFSQEPGIGFMEHYLIKKGELAIEDCVDYTETYDEESDEYTRVGGFEWEFQI